MRAQPFFFLVKIDLSSRHSKRIFCRLLGVAFRPKRRAKDKKLYITQIQKYCSQKCHMCEQNVFVAGCRTVSNNGSGSGLAPAQNILAVQVHLSTIFEVQVWFRFTQVKYYRFGSGSLT